MIPRWKASSLCRGILVSYSSLCTRLYCFFEGMLGPPSSDYAGSLRPVPLKQRSATFNKGPIIIIILYYVLYSTRYETSTWCVCHFSMQKMLFLKGHSCSHFIYIFFFLIDPHSISYFPAPKHIYPIDTSLSLTCSRQLQVSLALLLCQLNYTFSSKSCQLFHTRLEI